MIQVGAGSQQLPPRGGGTLTNKILFVLKHALKGDETPINTNTEDQMQNQTALKRRAETGVTVRIPLLPPPIPRSIPANIFSDREIREISKRIALDDQIVALRVDDDELAAQIAKVRRAGENTARDIRLRLGRVESDVRIAHSLAAEARRDIRALKVTSDAHAATLEQHRLGLVDHATHIVDIRETLKTLRADVADNYLLAATQTDLDALAKKVDRIAAWESANHCSYGALARDIATLKIQLHQLRAQTPAQTPLVAKRQPNRFFLWPFYVAVAMFTGGALAYIVMALG